MLNNVYTDYWIWYLRTEFCHLGHWPTLKITIIFKKESEKFTKWLCRKSHGLTKWLARFFKPYLICYQIYRQYWKLSLFSYYSFFIHSFFPESKQGHLLLVWCDVVILYIAKILSLWLIQRIKFQTIYSLFFINNTIYPKPFIKYKYLAKDLALILILSVNRIQVSLFFI